jgi:DNA modification methylase
MNTLYYGDNLDILRRYVEEESVDLIYLDPPFKSNQDYNVLFAEQDGTRSASQIMAFEDTWEWNQESSRAYEEFVEGGGTAAEAMIAFRAFLGSRGSDMLAYLAMMAPRLVELRRVLKETGSLYLHCDPTASHYLKILLDGIFRSENFRNEIIWQRTRVAKRQSNYFGKTHDVILLYTKSEAATYNPQFLEHPDSYKKSHYSSIEPETERRYGLWDFTQKGPGPARRFGNVELEPPAGKHWIWSQERIDAAMVEGRIVFTKHGTPRLKRYLDASKGEYLQDIWTDIFDVNAVAKERLHYPTQKPAALLDRIIQASSNEGDVVLDPFCGCGTAIESAEKLSREWIGIDITHLAVALIKHRLKTAFNGAAQYEVVGEPVSLPDACALAEENRFQFQCWSLGLVGARPTDPKRGADQGIDGRLHFHDDKPGVTKQIVISVKSGGIPANHIRELRGVVEREKAAIGLLITLEKPTKPMLREAASGGFYTSPFGNTKHPRVQILTIEELLGGRQIDCPRTDANVTFKKARRVRPAPAQPGRLPFDL